MPRDDLIIFLDLETTGVDENLDEIIEVGCVLLDANTLNEIGSFTSIIVPGKTAYDRWMRKDVVRDMHRVNGLQDEIDKTIEAGMSNLYDATNADSLLVGWLREFVGNNNTQIPYGGSGVAHFDRRFIKKYLPEFDKMITHWAYDVGTVRRQFIKAGLVPADDVLRDQKTEKDHRALTDARVHAEEFRMYQTFFKHGSFFPGITGSNDGLKDTAR